MCVCVFVCKCVRVSVCVFEAETRVLCVWCKIGFYFLSLQHIHSKLKDKTSLNKLALCEYVMYIFCQEMYFENRIQLIS